MSLLCPILVEDCLPEVLVEHEGPPGPDGPPGPAGGVTTSSPPVVNENIAVFDGTTGSLIKDGGKKISDLALASDLASKVDVVVGKGLSTEDFTTALKNKLTALSLGTYRGTHENEADLIAAITDANPGDYAYVVSLTPDPGAEQQLYIWDAINMQWTAVALGSTPYTSAEIQAALATDTDWNKLTDLLLAKINNSVDTATLNSVIATLSGVANPNNNVITEATTARTLGVNDVYKYFRLTNAAPCTITLPDDSTATWTLTPVICFRITTVPPTFTLGGGVVLNGIGNLAGLVADDNFCIKKVGVDEWDLVVGGVW